jgi:hypothetical protein
MGAWARLPRFCGNDAQSPERKTGTFRPPVQSLAACVGGQAEARGDIRTSGTDPMLRAKRRWPIPARPGRVRGELPGVMGPRWPAEGRSLRRAGVCGGPNQLWGDCALKIKPLLSFARRKARCPAARTWSGCPRCPQQLILQGSVISPSVPFSRMTRGILSATLALALAVALVPAEASAKAPVQAPPSAPGRSASALTASESPPSYLCPVPFLGLLQFPGPGFRPDGFRARSCP